MGLAALLVRIFGESPCAPVPVLDRKDDPIARALAAAVTEHERAAAEVRRTYRDRARASIDEVINHMGQDDDRR